MVILTNRNVIRNASNHMKGTIRPKKFPPLCVYQHIQRAITLRYDHEIQLGIGHYGRLCTHLWGLFFKCALEKISPQFLATNGQNVNYCKEAIKFIEYVNFHSINVKLRENLFQGGFSGSP